MFDPKVLLGYIVDGRYRLAAVCGTGSYGWVYAADEVAFGEVIGQVAVKLLRPPDEEARKAIIREVTAMRQFSHAHLLSCFSAGEISDGLARGCLYIATELASETLEARLKRPPAMTPEEVRELTEHMASALAYLCDRGAVHRDVKPANILRVGNLWKLGDFGLVRGFAGTSMQASGRKGTLLYMSPEALQGATGPFVDVWALGVVIQECLTGALPYSGNSDAEVIAAALAREPTIAPGLVEPFGSIVRGCLAQNHRQRWTPRHVLQAVGWAQRDVVVVAPEAAQSLRSSPEYRRTEATFLRGHIECVPLLRPLAEGGDSRAQYMLGSVLGNVWLRLEEAFEWFCRSAALDDPCGLCALALCYFHGGGTPKSFVAASAFSERGIPRLAIAARGGDPLAQRLLGACCEAGPGCPKDDHQAAGWYRKAAEQGYANAQNNLGRCYEHGVGVPKDEKQAVEWYRKAAEQGYAPAQNNLGVCYQYGVGVPKDEKHAVEWYRKAAEQGYDEAQYNLGVCYHYGYGVVADGKQAVEWYRKAAEKGNAIAQTDLGYCYHYGVGVPKDEKHAVEWYRKAAEQGYDEAQYNLGVCYHYGYGVVADGKQAVEWYRKAAEKEYADAQNNLGYCYRHGFGVPKDEKLGVEWYQKAARQGLAMAQCNLGDCYQYGVGVPKDEKHAVEWYRKAAEQGYADAQYKLGLCYANGIGVPRDPVEAVVWYRKAAEQGHQEACKKLAKIQ